MDSDDQELVASMFWSIAAGADDAFVVVDDDQQIVVFNEAAEALFGYSFDDVSKKSLELLIPSSISVDHQQLVRGFNVSESTWRSMSRRPSVQAVRADGSEFQAAITILKTTTSGSTLYGAIVRDVTGHERADALLQGTLTATAGVTGQEFFETAVRVLAETLDVHTAFIATPVPGVAGTSRMIANWSGGAIAKAREFELDQTPCSLAIDQAVVHIPSGVHDHFPELFLAKAKPAEGFLSLKLTAATGQFLGHITLLHSAELQLTQRELSSLRVFGSRIAAEIDRVRVNAEIASESDFRIRVSQSAPFGITHRNSLTGETWCNESFRRIFGRSYAECREIGWDKVVHPDDLADYLAESDEIRNTGEAAESVIRIIHPNGETRWIQRHGASRLDSDGSPVMISTTAIDMTATYTALEELRNKSEELDKRNAELEGSLNAFPDFHYRLGADGTYLSMHASEAASALIAPEHLLGANLCDYLSPGDADAAMAAIGESLESGQVTSVKFAWQTAGGLRHYEARYTPIGEDEVLAVVRDIGDLRALEAQVVHATTMKSVGLLASGLAHDFNNVLHVIGGHATALHRSVADGSDRDDQEATIKRIDVITRAVDRTSSLIERLMAISRPTPNNPAPTIIDELLLSLRPSLAQMLGADIELKLTLNAPSVAVLIDDLRLESAMLNLASNARDAMATGGSLEISTYPPGEADLEIRVSDTGVGMAPEIADNVFTPFFTTKSAGVGTGLGLATTYNTVAGANGSISVKSVPGEGSTFSICLPISNTTVINLDDVTPSDSGKAPNHTTVLVVEDEADVLELCTDTLRSLGYKVLQANSGEEALAVIRRGARIDGVLTDVAMPGMSGPELANQINRHDPAIPVVFMSGYSATALSESIPQGRLLTKPFSDASLDEMLSANLS